MNGPRAYEGWQGLHTRDQAPGAWSNGSRVFKVVAEETDAHGVGAMATVLGSMAVPPDKGGGYFYFVEWDDMEFCAVGVYGGRLGLAS